MKIENVRVVDLIPYEHNTKIHDKQQIDNVAESIRRFGFVQPVVVDDYNVIVIGHARTLARKKLGMKEVPCVRVSDLTDEEIRLLRIADNKTNESPWAFDELKLELEGLDLGDFSFDFQMPEDEETGGGEAAESLDTEEDDFDEEEEVESRVSSGDLWQLGTHRLICGDSLDPMTYERLMEGRVADMVFTDPPYGMGKENEGVTNDNMNYDDLLEFNKKWIPLTFQNMKKNGSWYCWGTDEPLMDIYSNILRPMKKLKGEDKLTFRNLITWDKGSGKGQMSQERRMYTIADEKCLFVMMGRQTYGKTIDDYWDGFEPIRQALIKMLKTDLGLSTAEVCEYAGRTTCSHWFSQSQWEFPSDDRFFEFLKNYTNRNREEYDRIREEYDRIREEWYATRGYFDNTHDNMNNVWHFDRVVGKSREEAGGHATPKPVALCGRAIKSSSREGEIVLDVFGGSGSTLIACEQLNRICYMSELEPHWCDVIIARWEKATGKKAVKL